MSSLTAKENKRRSAVSQRSGAKKTKKASPVKNKVRVSPKSKKLSVARPLNEAKQTARSPRLKKSAAAGLGTRISGKRRNRTSAASLSRATAAPKRTAGSKRTAGPKVGGAVSAAKPVSKARSGVSKRGTALSKSGTASLKARTATSVSKGAASSVSKAAARRERPQKPMPEPKPLPSPKTIAAIRAFESALKLFNRQDFSAARVAFLQIMENHPDQPDIAAPVRTYLAICDQKLSRMPARTRTPDALYDQGIFEFNRGNVETAIAIFEKALKAEPRADHLLYSLAAAYAREGHQSKSVETLRKAIAANPAHRSHARHDPDFAPLKGNREFQKVAGLDLQLTD